MPCTGAVCRAMGCYPGCTQGIRNHNGPKSKSAMWHARWEGGPTVYTVSDQQEKPCYLRLALCTEAAEFPSKLLSSKMNGTDIRRQVRSMRSLSGRTPITNRPQAFHPSSSEKAGASWLAAFMCHRLMSPGRQHRQSVYTSETGLVIPATQLLIMMWKLICLNAS